MKIWKRINPTVVAKIGWRTVVSKTFEMPDGTQSDFQIYDREDQHYVHTVALTTDNKVIIARQFRPGPEKVFEEIPGGYVDGDEDFQTAAARELLEETGYKVGSIKHIGDTHKDAFNNATWHAFLATDCVLVNNDLHLDDNEYVELDLISIEQLIANAKQDKMTDAVAVLLAYDELQARLK